VSPPSAVAALQAALAAENAAAYGYGVVGAHLSRARRAAAARDWVAHQNARDTLTVMLAGRAAPPAAAAAAYRLPFAVRGAAAAVSLAAYLEDRVTAAYLGLAGLGDPALREFGARAVRAAALRAAAWRGSTLAFPGFEMPVPGGSGRARGPAPGPSPSSG
jgi:hypothetical protein